MTSFFGLSSILSPIFGGKGLIRDPKVTIPVTTNIEQNVVQASTNFIVATLGLRGELIQITDLELETGGNVASGNLSMYVLGNPELDNPVMTEGLIVAQSTQTPAVFNSFLKMPVTSMILAGGLKWFIVIQSSSVTSIRFLSGQALFNRQTLLHTYSTDLNPIELGITYGLNSAIPYAKVFYDVIS